MQLCDKNTIFALNGNCIKDQSQSKISLTNTGVTTSQTQSKNFKNALYFNGSSYLTLNSTNLIPTTGDWTVDWWEWRDSSQTSGGAVFHQNYGSRTGYGFLLGYMNNNNNLVYAGNNGAWNILSGISCGVMQYGQWCHYAIVRSGGTFYTFQNGVQIATATSSASMMASTQKIQIGIYDYSTSTYFKGYIDSLRVSNVARWTTDFTPPEYIDGLKVKSQVKYTALPYLESTGTQYIDTGVKPTSNISVELDFQLNMTTGWACVFGGRDNDSNKNTVALWLNDTGQLCFYRDGNYLAFPSNVSASTRHYFKSIGNVANIDGNTVSVADSTFTGANNIYLFASNNAGTIARYSKMKLYYCKIYDNGTLVRNFIPCKNTSGKAGLYDLVNDKFYENAGTGTFTSGEVIDGKPQDLTVEQWEAIEDIYVKANRELRVLPYIESTGTQYIDTGVKTASDIDVEIDFQFTATPSTLTGVFGGRGATSNANSVALWWNKTFYYYWGTNQNKAFPTSVSATGRHYFKNNGNTADIDGVSVSLTNGTFTGTDNIYLLAANTGGTVGNFAKAKLYSCKIYDNDVLIRDFIPVLDWYDVPCLYDKVGRKLYYNAGSGTFNYPIDSDLPSDYTPVSYIQSNGTQYIDTGFKPNQNTRVVMDAEVSYSSTVAVFGARNSESSPQGAFICWAFTSAAFRSDFGSANAYVYVSPNSGRLTIDKNKQVITIGETSVTNTSYTFQCNYPLTLFTNNDNYGADSRMAAMKLYSCKIYDNGTLVRDYVPAKDLSGIVCLYEKVEKKFYYNKGSGTFTAGDQIGVVTAATDVSTGTIEHLAWYRPEKMYVKASENLTVLDYIESTGTQYIDTGVIGKTGISVDCGFEILSGNFSDLIVVGCSAKSYNPRCYMIAFQTYFAYGYGNWNISSQTASFNKRYDVSVDFSDNIQSMTVDSTVVKTTTVTTDYNTGYNIFAFGSNMYGTFSGYGSQRIYYLKFYDNGILIRDFIPVLDGDNVPCFYDKVTNQFFYNQGTGEFVAGYKSTFEPETELAFLESTGTQYIDTGFKPNHNTRVVIGAQFTSVSSIADTTVAVLFGARTSATLNNYAFVVWYNQLRTDYNNSYSINFSVNPLANLTIDKNKEATSVNGETLSYVNEVFQTPVNLTLFALNNNDTVQWNCSAKLYYCKIYDNDILVRDYIPKTDASGILCLYDKVSQTYYYNKGTGTFNAGTILKHVYWKQVI